MRWRRLSLLLCVVNWVAFLAFLIVRDPAIEPQREIGYSAGDETFQPLPSGHARSHIAGRPLDTWNSWHGGESTFVKATEIANLPSLVVATIVASPATHLLFPRSGSYYLESWVRAWIFVVVASAQWIGVGWLIGRMRRSDLRRNHAIGGRPGHRAAAGEPRAR